GWIVLIVLLISFWRDQPEAIPKGKAVAPVTGFSACFTSMLANAAGPIMAIYLMAVKLPKKTFIGTKAWFFLIINFIKVPLMFFGAQSINSDSLVLNAKLIPAIIIGGLLGIKAVKHIPEEKFKLAIKVLVLTASLKLIFS
ncbi:MAG: sulfite exporter TauE/SafE family protein, partial [Lentisphaeraceae bacterium]|nr:sulfite exporter TauE/SafE family protein [Lentisphaeraceae bacterium]